MATNLRALRQEVWKAFEGVGGTKEMFANADYDDTRQAYYGGQVVAFDHILSMIDRPHAEMPRKQLTVRCPLDGKSVSIMVHPAETAADVLRRIKAMDPPAIRQDVGELAYEGRKIPPTALLTNIPNESIVEAV